MKAARVERVANQMQQEIAMIIQRELKDPSLGFVTITRLMLSRDLSHARVLFSCLGGEEERRRCQTALDRSSGFIRGLIRKRFRIKVIPEITFRYDASIEGSIEMSKLLERLNTPSPTEREE